MNANTDILTLRKEVLDQADFTSQRPGQTFFNYFLSPKQQDYALKHYPELYHISSKVKFTAWLYTYVVDTQPITLRNAQ